MSEPKPITLWPVRIVTKTAGKTSVLRFSIAAETVRQATAIAEDYCRQYLPAAFCEISAG